MKQIKKFFSNHAYFSLSETTYLNLIIILAPMINFLCGISIDLYAPSMPAIGTYFHASMLVVQSTVAATMAGFAIGCILSGILFDVLGRRKIIITALLIFIISSLLAPFCLTISQLMVIRFIQGMTTSALSIGSRALVSDHFTGHRFVIAILYTSFAYGFGPVIAPFIGGYLQYHFGWQSNFYAFGLIGIASLTLFVLFVHERFTKPKGHTLAQVIYSYKTLVTHKVFILSGIILGCLQAELLIYPTIGPFLIEHQLGYSSIIYGNSALVVGLGYLFGSLVSRFMIRTYSQPELIRMGFYILGISLLSQLIFSLTVGLNLWTLVIPMVLIGFASGFIFGNILSAALKIFPNNIGVASATQLFLVMLLASVCVMVVSSFHITLLIHLFYACLGLITLQLGAYVWFLRSMIVN